MHQYDILLTAHEVRRKGYLEKSQEKTFIGDRYTFRICLCLDKNYSWIRLNNNTNGVLLESLAIIPYTSMET